MRKNIEFNEKEIGAILMYGVVGIFLAWNVLFKMMQVIFM